MYFQQPLCYWPRSFLHQRQDKLGSSCSRYYQFGFKTRSSPVLSLQEIFFFFFLAQKNPRWRPSFFLTSLDWQVEIFIPPSLKRAAFCIQALVGAGVTELVLCLQELRALAPAPTWGPIPDYTHEVPVPWEPLLITKPHPWGRPPSQHVSRGSGLHSCFNFCHLVISHSLVRELSCILIFLF